LDGTGGFGIQTLGRGQGQLFHSVQRTLIEFHVRIFLKGDPFALSQFTDTGEALVEEMASEKIMIKCTVRIIMSNRELK